MKHGAIIGRDVVSLGKTHHIMRSWRSEGGVGTVLLDQNHHFRLAAVFAIQLTILLLGLIQDYGIGLAKNLLCPYAALTLERK